MMQRQRELAQHQRNGVVAGGELELARQDAQIGVHIACSGTGRVEQGAPLGAASVVVSLVVVILGTVRSCAPAILAQREQPESRIINKLDDNGHPASELFQLQG
jgi:hypothetical protein